MVLFFGVQKAHIAPVELADLIVFIGKSFGGSGAGDTAFHIGVDLCYTFLNVLAGGFHSHTGTHDKNQNGGQQYKHSQGNAPFDAEHHRKGSRQRDAGNHHVFRTVVGQFRYLKQIIGHPGEELSGADVVIKTEGEGLNVGKDIPAHIRFNVRAQTVSPIGDDILEAGPNQICQHGKPQQQQEFGHETVIGFHGRDKLPEQILGEKRKGYIHPGHAESTYHIQGKELLVGPKIGHKSFDLIHTSIISEFIFFVYGGPGSKCVFHIPVKQRQQRIGFFGGIAGGNSHRYKVIGGRSTKILMIRIYPERNFRLGSVVLFKQAGKSLGQTNSPAGTLHIPQHDPFRYIRP